MGHTGQHATFILNCNLQLFTRHKVIVCTLTQFELMKSIDLMVSALIDRVLIRLVCNCSYRWQANCILLPFFHQWLSFRFQFIVHLKTFLILGFNLTYFIAVVKVWQFFLVGKCQTIDQWPTCLTEQPLVDGCWRLISKTGRWKFTTTSFVTWHQQMKTKMTTTTSTICETFCWQSNDWLFS